MTATFQPVSTRICRLTRKQAVSSPAFGNASEMPMKRTSRDMEGFLSSSYGLCGSARAGLQAVDEIFKPGPQCRRQLHRFLQVHEGLRGLGVETQQE